MYFFRSILVGLLIWVTFPLIQLYGILLICLFGMLLVDKYIIVIYCWVYSLRWDRTGASSIATLSLVVLVISFRLWFEILK